VKGISCPVTGGLNIFIKTISENTDVGWLHVVVRGGLHNFVKDIVKYFEVEAVSSLVI